MQCKPHHQLFLLTWIVCCALALHFFLPNLDVFAQPAPIDRSTDVNATVPDWIAPSTPILIAPTDAAFTSDNTPTFVWQAATDNVAVSGYALYRDGVVAISGIPTNAADTMVFTLTYDSGTQRYSLTPKSSISDGTHTWKVAALDAAGNTTSSATWTFSIDSQAPAFVITAIGSETTSISVQDSSTIPTVAIELTENEPLLTGTGEANSSVLLQVRSATDDTLVDEYTYSIGSDGTWSVQLNTLERETQLTLTFQITDHVGLLSILEDVPLIIGGYVIEIPLPEELPIDSPIVIPIDVIPVEIISRTIRVIQLNLEQNADTVASVLLPEGAQARFVSTKHLSTRLLSPLWYTQLLVFFMIALLPLVKWLLLSKPFGRNFSLTIGLSVWKAVIGYSEDTQHDLVISAGDQQPLPFVTARLLSVSDSSSNTTRPTDIMLSDQYGFLPLPPRLVGAFKLQICQDETMLEFTKERPAHLDEANWYQGETLQLTQGQIQAPLVIPVIAALAPSLRPGWKSWILRQSLDSSLILVLAVIFTIITPTIGNLVCMFIFGGFWLVKNWQKRLANIQLAVRNVEKKPIACTVVRCLPEVQPNRQWLLQTNTAGDVSFRLKTGIYSLHAVHHQYQQHQPLTLTTHTHEDVSQLLLMLPTGD